jgi:hypothetical protein
MCVLLPLCLVWIAVAALVALWILQPVLFVWQMVVSTFKSHGRSAVGHILFRGSVSYACSTERRLGAPEVTGDSAIL